MPFDVREVHLALNNSPHGSDTSRDSLFEGSETQLEGDIQKPKRYKGDHKDKFKHPDIYQGASIEGRERTKAFP